MKRVPASIITTSLFRCCGRSSCTFFVRLALLWDFGLIDETLAKLFESCAVARELLLRHSHESCGFRQWTCGFQRFNRRDDAGIMLLHEVFELVREVTVIVLFFPAFGHSLQMFRILVNVLVPYRRVV